MTNRCFEANIFVVYCVSNIGKGDEKEEYICSLARENRPLAERRFQEGDMEGSF